MEFTSECIKQYTVTQSHKEYHTTINLTGLTKRRKE